MPRSTRSWKSAPRRESERSAEMRMRSLSQWSAVALIVASTSAAARAQMLTDTEVEAAIKAGTNRKLSGWAAECDANSGRGERFNNGLVGGSQARLGGYDVTVSGSAGRIAVMAAEAKRLYKPFAVADVPADVRANTLAYVAVNPKKPNYDQTEWAAALIDRVVLRAQSKNDAVVQPADFTAEPIEWTTRPGGKIPGNRASASFPVDLVRELPPGGIEVIVITPNGERRCNVGADERRKIFGGTLSSR